MPNLLNSYSWMINTCDAANVGYSQDYRNQQLIDGICYYDCSSIIWYSLMAGGFDCIKAYNEVIGPYYGNAFTTWNEPEVLRYLGFNQKELNREWKPGDILIRNNHTEMVYQGFYGFGRTMGAHSDDVPLPEQVSINNFMSTGASWEELWRYPNESVIRPILMRA